MNISGRILKIKRTKKNIFLTINNGQLSQIVIKEDKYHLCHNLNIGDIITCEVLVDTNNFGKYKTELSSFLLEDLNIVSKNILNDHLSYSYDNLKEYSDAKLRIRNYLNHQGYLEVNVPILTDGETSSKAESFKTEYSKFNKSLFLRKTMDSFLRMYSCSDLNRVYSIGICFRNGYVTSKNIPEFEMLSIFTNYATYEEIISLAKKIIKTILNESKLKIKRIDLCDYDKFHERDIFYIIEKFKNLKNSYSDNNGDYTEEFKVKYNDITVIHGVKEISNYDKYIEKISEQGKKKEYGELKRLENMLNSGAPICYNLGISIIRILAVYHNKKLKDYDSLLFTRLESRGEKVNEKRN